MRRLLVIFSILIFPFVTFGDVLPEPEYILNEESTTDIGILSEIDDEKLAIDEEIISNTENIEENVSTNEIEYSEDNQLLDDSSNENEFPDGGMSMISYGFCNNGFENITESLNVATTQQAPFKVCFIWQNNSDIDLTIDASLVDTTIDNLGNNVCGLETSFNNFIVSGELGKITIPAQNYIIKEFEVMFPLGFEGEQKGCLVYNMVNGEDGGGIGLKVVVRQGAYMNFFVGAIDGIKNELTVTDLQTKLDDNKDLILSFWVENTGNMENTFDIQGHVKGFFGYDKKFEIVSGQVAPSKSQYIEANLGSLPSYGGKFNIDFTINGTPFFSYDISNANIDPSWLEPKSWDFGTTYFKMPWLILAVVVIFILLLIAMFRKPKQKVVYVQQPSTPQPQQPGQQPVQQVTQPQQTVQSVQQPVNPQNPNQPIQQ